MVYYIRYRAWEAVQSKMLKGCQDRSMIITYSFKNKDSFGDVDIVILGKCALVINKFAYLWCDCNSLKIVVDLMQD
jgi:hypothetical protein